MAGGIRQDSDDDLDERLPGRRDVAAEAAAATADQLGVVPDDGVDEGAGGELGE